MPEFPIVGIGSSAGGLEALQKLFRAMPADSGLAFVLAAHLDPTQTSHLAELIGHCTKMPVVEVGESTKVVPNHVYVIAPDRELTIRGGVLETDTPAVPRGQRHPVDAFFRSLAEDQAGRAIAIVLSGAGTNGTQGLRFVKAEGGITIAQDPHTAEFSGMPQSAIGTGIVDMVLPPEKIPEALVGLARHPYVRQPEKVIEKGAPDDQFDDLLSLIRAETKHDFSGYKKTTLLRRTLRRMGLQQIDGFNDYIEKLRADPGEVSALVADLTINVTGFFRDPDAWHELDERVIEPLVRERPSGSSLRVWVPGCSTGEEAYSIAMLVTERAEAAGKTFDLRIFATDVEPNLLTMARNGIYPASLEADLGPERLARFFGREDDSYRIRKPLREAITFAPQNLLRDPPFSRMDLVSCRNLLIYLRPERQKMVLRLFHFALRSGGYLFLGPAETISGAGEYYRTVSKKWRIYKKLGSTRDDIVDFPLLGLTEPSASDLEPDFAHPPRPGAREIVEQAILDRHAPACVLIDRQQTIRYLRGPTEHFLQLGSGEPSNNLLAMARVGLQVPLRSAVRKAIDQNREVIADAHVRRGEQLCPVRVVVTPLRAENGGGGLLICFFERESKTAAEDAAESDLPEDDLQTQLDATRDELRLTIEQMEASNEELKASNEELETSSEELQSLNEELYTLNNQLQAKVSELEARTDDLNNLLRSTDIATLFLDRDLRIRWSTPSMNSLFELRQSDIGRPLSHFAQRFSGDDLLSDAKDVLANLVTADSEVASDDGRWYVRHIAPYRTSHDLIDGVVVTFTDITQRKKAEDTLRASEERLKRVLETEAVGVLFFDNQDGTLIGANDAYLKMTGYRRREVENRELSWRMMTPEEWMAVSEEQMQKLAETGRIGPYEKEYLRKDGSRAWMLLVGRSLGDGTTVEFCIDITDRKMAEEERGLLARELSHRVKNTLGVVQALATMTNGRIETIENYREAFLGRLHALAQAHSLLLDSNWQSTSLRTLVGQTAALFREEDPQTVTIEGDEVMLLAKQAMGLSLVLHELGTNAVKYGALSVHGGRLLVSWKIDKTGERRLVRLRWRERGGPRVQPPDQSGFGLEMIKQMCSYELDGEASLDFAAEGLSCEITFPIE